jgi:hypothetical protein
MPTVNAQHAASDDNVREESVQEILARSTNGEYANDPNEGNIIHTVRFIDSSGNVGEKVHGPMPRGEWTEYSRKNGL